MKNLSKSIFISAFPAFVIYVIVVSCLHLLNQDTSLSTLGNLLSSGTIMFFFAKLFIKPQARTSENLPIFSFLIIFGFILSTVSISVLNDKNAVALLLSSILILLWIIYLKWFSVFEKRDSNLLKVGNKLPIFEVEDISEKITSSETFLGKPTIYLFYRGNWCPLCMAQIKEIAAQYKELEKRGVTMNFISPQPHGYSNKLAERYNLGFNFLTDKGNKAAKKLGVFSENGIPTGFQAFGFDSDTVLPTVIITDKNGEIIFLDETDNYRVRPEPDTFLKVLDNDNVSRKGTKILFKKRF